MDIFHFFSEDLTINSNGDLEVVDGLEESQQQIIRRILTPEDGYIWANGYGLGAGGYIGGTTNDTDKLRGLIVQGLSQEQSVSQIPPPNVTVTNDQDKVQCTIEYVEKSSGKPKIISFSTGA